MRGPYPKGHGPYTRPLSEGARASFEAPVRRGTGLIRGLSKGARASFEALTPPCTARRPPEIVGECKATRPCRPPRRRIHAGSLLQAANCGPA